jgi:1-acyl-sn-glycerol-3-phosphate acyltransferase
MNHEQPAAASTVATPRGPSTKDAALGRPPREPTYSALFLFVYNLFYWSYLAATCVLFFAPALVLFALTVPWDPRRRLLHAYTCVWGAHYLAWAPFAGVTVRGRENVPASGGCIFVSNHVSMVDILAVFAIRLPFLWVSKVENFRVPFLGWNMSLNGYVKLRRKHLPSIRRMLRECAARLSDGYNLCVFPEGTRSPDGQLQPFHRGAFWLAARHGVPVVPIVLDGTDRILRKHSLKIVPQRVTVSILEPIHPESAGYDDRKLAQLVRARMLAEQTSAAEGAAPPLESSR